MIDFSTRTNLAYGILLAFCSSVFSGCSDGGLEPVGDRYILTSVNGVTLPATTQDVVFKSGMLVLSAGNNFVLIVDVSTIDDEFSTTSTTVGTYSISGSSIRMWTESVTIDGEGTLDTLSATTSVSFEDYQTVDGSVSTTTIELADDCRYSCGLVNPSGVLALTSIRALKAGTRLLFELET